MTSAQFEKIELRLRSLLKQQKLVSMIIWEDLDGTIRLQVTESKAETIVRGEAYEPLRRTSI